MPLEALVFDVDGTLAETEEVHRQAFNETFAAEGMAWNWDRERYRVLLRTTGGKERMRRHANDVGDDVPDVRIAALHAAKTLRYGRLIEAGAAVLRPGIAAMIADARAHGLRLGVATTTSGPNVDALCLAAFGAPAGEVFEVVAAGDEVKSKKPAPDVYLLALQRLGLPAASCLAFEDSRNGLVAASGAGLVTLVAPSAYTRGEDFSGAAVVLADFSAVASTSRLREIHGAAMRRNVA